MLKTDEIYCLPDESSRKASPTSAGVRKSWTDWKEFFRRGWKMINCNSVLATAEGPNGYITLQKLEVAFGEVDKSGIGPAKP